MSAHRFNSVAHDHSKSEFGGRYIYVGDKEMPNNHYLRPRGIPKMLKAGAFFLSTKTEKKIMDEHMSQGSQKSKFNVPAEKLDALLVSTLRNAQPFLVTDNECVVLRWHTDGPVGKDPFGRESNVVMMIVSMTSSKIVSVYPDFKCVPECSRKHETTVMEDWYLPALKLFSPSDADVQNRPVSHLLISQGLKPPAGPHDMGFFADIETKKLDFKQMRIWSEYVMEKYWSDIKETDYVAKRLAPLHR